MLRQKVFFLSLLFLGALFSAYFSLETAIHLFHYSALKIKAPVQILRWEVKEIGGKFPITAYYTFEAEGKLCHGDYQFPKPWHLNEMAAVAAVQKKAKQNFNIWFDPQNPLISDLEKIFPTSLIIRTALCYIILLYFITIFRKITYN